MKTIHELRKSPPLELVTIIDKDVRGFKKQYKDELTNDYFASHPDEVDIPVYINTLYDDICNYSVIGQLKGSLIFAIRELQKAEAKLQSQKV